MPRKGPPVKRETEPDPIYQNPLVTQLTDPCPHRRLAFGDGTPTPEVPGATGKLTIWAAKI